MTKLLLRWLAIAGVLDQTGRPHVVAAATRAWIVNESEEHICNKLLGAACEDTGCIVGVVQSNLCMPPPCVAIML